jgi:nucleoside-diphosphate-sugar epimerase
MTQTVLILGASGKIGRHGAKAFAAAGWQVREFDRAKGNMLDAAAGVDVIVNAMNPPNYHNWAVIIPQITTQVIAAARVNDATVIIPGNVYNFGPTPGVWSDLTPQRPNTRKGRIRVDMERAYRDAGVRTIVLRAGNFIDPDGDDDVMGMMILRQIAKGRITDAGGADVMQAYCYLPDWARTAVSLSEKRTELAVFEDVALGGHAFTLNELKATLEAALGRDLRLVRFPWWVMTLCAPFWELARELREMRYLWGTSHSLSDVKLRTLLGDFEPTDMRSVMLAGLPRDIHPDQSVTRGAAVAVTQNFV